MKNNPWDEPDNFDDGPSSCPSPVAGFWIALILGIGISILAFLSTSCAQTVFLKDGRPVAIIQGNLDGTLRMDAKGAVTVTGRLNHSEATTAAGAASEAKLTALAGLAAASAFAP